MSSGSWFKVHRRSLITHTSVVLGFVLFVIFVSEPLFDRLEQVPGESQLYETTLPAATNNIQYHFSLCQITAQMLEINGWTFIKGHDSINNEIYIVLKSADRTHIFTTDTVIRRDVTQARKELGLNLDYSGFAALIPGSKIANGDYTVGFYIRKGDVEALQFTSKAVIKSGDTIKIQ
jgi:hypothetical protein